MNLPAEAGTAGDQTGWRGHIAADDVDARLAQLLQVGGAVRQAAQDIPGVGRFATVADPQGTVCCLFKGNSDQPPLQPPAGTPGTMGWHELYAGDLDSAWAFYSALFGWTKDEAIDTGEMTGPSPRAAAGAGAGAGAHARGGRPMISGPVRGDKRSTLRGRRPTCCAGTARPPRTAPR